MLLRLETIAIYIVRASATRTDSAIRCYFSQMQRLTLYRFSIIDAITLASHYDVAIEGAVSCSCEM